MIDLTPLDVRKKKGDFRRGLRGYDAPQVDDFLDIVADRLESLVRENLALQERVARFENHVTDYREREKALTEALVTAQEMREEVRAQSAKEANAARREAENDAARIRADAQQVRECEEAVLRRLRGRQLEFLQTYRAFLERELAELASTVRGLELNGTMGDAFLTPPPRLPDPAAEPGAASAAGAAAAAEATRGGSPELKPKNEWAAPASAATSEPAGSGMAREPLALERSEIAALPADTRPPVQAGRQQAPDTADGWAGPAQLPSQQPTSVGRPEPELILSDDDVLSDDDDAAADSSQPGPGPEPEPEAEAAEPTRPVEAMQPDSDLDVDLIPELDDVAELGDAGREEARPPLDAKAVDDAGPAASDAERSASKRRHVGDDTDDLLRSLFGDEH